MKTFWLVVIVAVSCFFLGRFSKKQVEKITYVKGKEVTGNVSVELPKKEIKPLKPLLPYKYIFIEGTKTEVVDTARILEDYTLKRTYEINLFDDLHGKLDLKPTLQYNKLSEMSYTFKPMIQKVSLKDKWVFYGSTSYNTFNIGGLGGGFFYKDIGLEYKYLWQVTTGTTGHEVGIKFMF